MLKPCPSCGAHKREATACPYCEPSTGGSGISSAVLLGLVLAMGACAKQEDQALYGVAFIDVDEDGYDEEVDCNDDDPTVHPDADETVGDDVDSNCDGEDDT